MQMLRERPWYAAGNEQRLTLFALAVIAVIAALDSVVIPNLGFGFLYLIPLCLAAVFMSPWQIVVVSGVCTAFVEGFSRLPAGAERIPRVIFGFLGFTFVALMIREMAAYRRTASRHLGELEQEVSLRHRAEEQLELLINSSPAAVVAVLPDGRIGLANRAAHQLLGVEPGALTAQPIATFLPELNLVQATGTGATIECRAVRASGESFVALVALSTFTSAAGSTTAAIFLDEAGTQRNFPELGRQ